MMNNTIQNEKFDYLEKLISSVVQSDMKEKLLTNRKHCNITNLPNSIKTLINDLQKSYGIHLDVQAITYLSSICNYINDDKDALVLSAWIAYFIKTATLHNEDNIIPPQLSKEFIKLVPLPSKKLMILLWSETISNYAFNHIEYKHSMHRTTYASNLT
jgi:hypothetical protein